MKKRGTIKITLMSDLCVGSGYSYFGSVDNDTSYDADGIPYIPARRIKGCLREAADLVASCDRKLQEETTALFGEAGSASAPGLSVGNGYLAGYDALCSGIREMRTDPEKAAFLSPQSILAQFTSVRAQTKLVQGIADDTSLRYTRVIRQYSGVDDKNPVQFQAEVVYEEKEEETKYTDLLKTACLALRHLGLDRNRGLGSVVCSFRQEQTGTGSLKSASLKLPSAAGRQRVQVFLKNIGPLMISEADNDSSADYIPGKAFIGALAARYISIPGKSADDPAFQDLFVNGSTLFSNLTVTDGSAFYNPAPSYINKLKKTGRYVDTLQYDPAKADPDSPWYPGDGNQPKKLKGKYVTITDDHKVRILEPEKQVIFHHRREKDNQDALLYSHAALAQGQIWTGYIEYPAQYAQCLEMLLNGGDLYLGKSRTAQYGKCRVFKVTESPLAKQSYQAGDVLLVCLASDGIFRTYEGEAAYTVRFDEVYRLIAKDLGIDGAYAPLDSETMRITGKGQDLYSLVSAGYVYGYSSVWNLRRAPIPCIEAGSTFTYVLKSDVTIQTDHVGRRCYEGMGKVHIEKLADMPYRLEEAAESTAASDKDQVAGEYAQKIIVENVKGALFTAIQEDMQERVESSGRLSVSASTLGRITLMLQESMQKAGPGLNGDAVLPEFMKRILSIKRKAEHEEALRFMDVCVLGAFKGREIGDAGKAKADPSVILGGAGKESAYGLLCALTGRDQADAYVCAIWPYLVRTVLVSLKYQKKMS